MREINILEVLEKLRLVQHQLSLVLVDAGLTLSQFRLLKQIAADGPVSATDLSIRLRISKAAMTTQIKELEKAQLLAIKPHPTDRRSSLIALSARGQKRLEVALRNIALAETEIAEKLYPSINRLTRSSKRNH